MARGNLLIWLVVAWLIPSATLAQEAAVAVLDFELKNLTLAPDDPAERTRTASLKALLEDALSARHLRVVRVASSAQRLADQGVGYLFDHADAAATLGHTVGADWIVVGRVHKASFLFVYLKAHVVNVSNPSRMADLVVEVKGPQQELTQRGVESLADQITAAVEGLSH